MVQFFFFDIDLDIFNLLPLLSIKNIAALIRRTGIKFVNNSLDNWLTSKVPINEPINDKETNKYIFFSFNNPFL